MKAILLFILCVWVFGNDVNQDMRNLTHIQAPLIVEFAVFKEAEKLCNGSDYTKVVCLVGHLKNYSNKIYTKRSGQNAQIAVLFYALDSLGKPTYSSNIGSKYCEFVDTFGKKSVSRLSGNGFSYILNYNFNYSSSKAYIACYINQNNHTISQISQPISVIPYDFDINLTMKTAQDMLFPLNTQNPPTPNLSKMEYESYTNNTHFALTTQTHPIYINPQAIARTMNGSIDEGFSGDLLPLSIQFSRDNGLCAPIGESINGSFQFRNGKYIQNNININFIDVASGELEIVLGHNLDSADRAQGKCLNEIPSEINITNAGKILCQKPIIIKKRVDVIPYSFFITLDTNGRQMYYNQHTFIPAISHLPMTKIDIKAINDRNQMLKNFTKDCFAKDLSIKLDDNKNNLLFINENIPDSIIPKATFLQDSQSLVIRQLSSSGIKDRDLTPADLFNSTIVNLNDTYLSIRFYNYDVKYPVYHIKPIIKNDWRIALLRGRISLLENTNTSNSLVANPKIVYEFYCKSPTCKIVDIESTLSPKERFPQSIDKYWYINTAHPLSLKVEENHLILGESLKLYSLGNIVNGVQTLAIESNQKGVFDMQIKQGYNDDNFALFLYFAPSYINIRENLGVRSQIRF